MTQNNLTFDLDIGWCRAKSTDKTIYQELITDPYYGAAYACNAQNRLTSATVNGVITEFTYDSRNRVVQRTSGNGTLNLTYSGWNLIEERNASGALEQVYVHGAGIDEIRVKMSSSGPAYYHHDGLGCTIALTGEWRPARKLPLRRLRSGDSL